jgi:hypothetical protein
MANLSRRKRQFEKSQERASGRAVVTAPASCSSAIHWTILLLPPFLLCCHLHGNWRLVRFNLYSPTSASRCPKARGIWRKGKFSSFQKLFSGRVAPFFAVRSEMSMKKKDRWRIKRIGRRASRRQQTRRHDQQKTVTEATGKVMAAEQRRFVDISIGAPKHSDGPCYIQV